MVDSAGWGPSSRRRSQKPEQFCTTFHSWLLLCTAPWLPPQVLLLSCCWWVHSALRHHSYYYCKIIKSWNHEVMEYIIVAHCQYTRLWDAKSNGHVIFLVCSRMVLGVCAQADLLQVYGCGAVSPVSGCSVVGMHLLQHPPCPLTVCRVCWSRWKTVQLHLHRGQCVC